MAIPIMLYRGGRLLGIIESGRRTRLTFSGLGMRDEFRGLHLDDVLLVKIPDEQFPVLQSERFGEIKERYLQGEVDFYVI